MNKFLLLIALAAAQPIFCEKIKDQKIKTAVNQTKKQNIKKLFDLTMNKEQTRKIMQASFDQVNVQFAEVTKKFPKKVKKLYDNFLNESFEAITSDEMLEKTAAIYDKYFNAEDIKELLKFYESPTGKKSIQVMPQLMGEVMGLTFSVIQDGLKRYTEEIAKFQIEGTQKIAKKIKNK